VFGATLSRCSLRFLRPWCSGRCSGSHSSTSTCRFQVRPPWHALVLLVAALFVCSLSYFLPLFFISPLPVSPCLMFSRHHDCRVPQASLPTGRAPLPRLPP
jgi:hypothetical protein